MIVYKLKHIPTGLFFKPSGQTGNLSKTGKIYSKKPSISWALTLRIKYYLVGRINAEKKSAIDLMSTYFKVDHTEKKYVDVFRETKETDWEIIEL